MNNAVHFVEFRCPTKFYKASQVFGQPDFVHYYWDVRAQQEIAPGDTVVFGSNKTVAAPPNQISFDDSRMQ